MFFQELTRIPFDTSGGGVSKDLPPFMQHQSQTNWCWAANGASVGNYYYGPNSYSQCGIANTCLNMTICCGNPTPNTCNVYGYLDKALQAANSFDSMKSGTTSYNDIQTRINVNQPIGTRVAWTKGGAHFMMISGYNTDGNKMTIQDPWYGPSTVTYAQYPENYHGGGTWTHTYFTKKNN